MAAVRSLLTPASAAGLAGLLVGLNDYDKARCGADVSGLPTKERVSNLEQRLNTLEVAAAVSTHAAFVFIKPHAANSEQCYSLVKNGLAKSGIAIASEGQLSGVPCRLAQLPH